MLKLPRFFPALWSLSAVLACSLLGQPLAAQQVAFTFDDLPVHGPLPPGVTRADVIRQILQALQQSGGPPVYGFVNGSWLVQQPESRQILELWRQAGYPLGNHTWSHMNLNEHSVEDWEADVLRNEPVLKPLMQDADWHWLRYPYLAEGNTPEKGMAARSFLAVHHYRIAGVTASFADYLFNDPYARCMAKPDMANVKHLEDEYLEAARQDLADRRAAAQAAAGHDIPYVLLMHVGAFDAHMLPQLISMYRKEGVSFVSLQQAEQDPFYANDVNPALPATPDTLEAVAGAKHLSVPRQAVPPADLDSLCR